jgi:hypothetical protein
MMMKSLVAMRSSTSHCRVYFYSNAIGFKDMMMRGLALRRRVFFCSNVASHSSPHQ